MNTPTPEEAAWLGGLFEGEGCFTIRKRNGRAAGGACQLLMTDRDTVERFGRILGVGTLRVKKPSQPGRKVAYGWTLNGFEANQAFIAFIWPWLGARRKARAAEVLTLVASQRARRRRCPHEGLQRTASGNCTACQLESYHRLRRGERVYKQSAQ